MSEAKKARSDAVAKQMGKMLLGGCKMLATSCEICDCVIMQDREGNQMCVNCDIEGKNDKAALPVLPPPNAVAPTHTEDHGDHSQTEDVQDGYLDAVKVDPANSSQNGASMKIYNDIELGLFSEMQRTTSRLLKLPAEFISQSDRDAKAHYLAHIRDCANTIAKVRAIFHK